MRAAQRRKAVGLFIVPPVGYRETGDNKNTLRELGSPLCHSGSPPCHTLTLEHTLEHCAAFYRLPMQADQYLIWQMALPRTRRERKEAWSGAPHSQPQGHSEEATVSPSFSFASVRGRVPSLSQSTQASVRYTSSVQ